MHRSIRAALAVAAIVVSSTIALTASPEVAAGDDKMSAEAFRADMRSLWEDHIVWTRQYIVSAATFSEDLPDIGPTAERLFRNQTDIGNAIAGFYGDAAGDALTELLNGHIAIAAEAVGAARDGNKPALDSAIERWYANADEIASFLAEANARSWPFEMMQGHMHDHLDLTLAEAVARLGGNYADDIAAYDQIHAQILQMADMLSDGIITAFPSRFSR